MYCLGGTSLPGGARSRDFAATSSNMEQETTEVTESITWNSDTSYALGLYRLITAILGIWPIECQDVFSKFRVCTAAFLQISMMTSMIVEMNTECSSISGIVEVISLISCAIMALLKLLVLRGFNPRMLEVMNSAVKDWSRPRTSRERSIMRKHAKLGRSVCIFQMVSAYATIVPMVILPLPFLAPSLNATDPNVTEATTVRGLPLSTTCIFGDVSAILYPIIYSVQALQLIIVCTSNVGNDVYFFGITMHLCGQFQLLGEELENFEINVDKKKEREKLVEIIRRNFRLGQLAQYLEDSFNFIILVQISANALQMCLMGIQMILSLKSGNTFVLVNTVIILYVMTLQLYLYSYAGDRLSSQMANLRIAAYFAPWYEMQSRLAKDVLFMIMRNNKSFNITAGKVYRIDIDNFKNLIKALGSYFSVLRIMFDA